jgi:hypothetical protein
VKKNLSGISLKNKKNISIIQLIGCSFHTIRKKANFQEKIWSKILLMMFMAIKLWLDRKQTSVGTSHIATIDRCRYPGNG